jgi:threonyl-tRNA synthetase
LAKSISGGLLKASVIGEVNGSQVDLTKTLSNGDNVKLITDRDPAALEVLRHSAAHLMAAAILKEFPKAQLTIGPVTDDGFFYDIYLPDGVKITEDDFPKIEKRMAALASEEAPFVRCVAPSELDPVFQSYRMIDGGHNKFKQEIMDELKNCGAFSGKPDAPEVSFYRTGEFIDLCRGPHVPHSGWLKHVKLMRVSGSYWRADQAREGLTRVYGTAFFKKADLEAHLLRLEEAKKRDHRVLGEQLDLFHFEEEAPGMPFLHANGAMVYNRLQDFMRAQLMRRGYQEVRTPIVLSESMWHTSGHYDNYLENMFFTKKKHRDEKDAAHVHDNVDEDRPMAVKPMNCPGHVMIYKHGLHSYNELPLRICEMGLVHRRELSGVRHGMFRVQAFVQDDAHHFCTPDQIGGEVNMLIDFFFEVYRAFGLGDVHLELSTRPEKYVGTLDVWEKAEKALKDALESGGREYKLNPGDGAFYGPKIDFHIRDAIGRSWQCGTIQLDFSMPMRFGCEYVAKDGSRQVPVMIHRACFGSVDRFFGIITEHFAGAFPLWLAPMQVQVVPVSEKFLDYAKQVNEALLDEGIRSSVNTKDDRLGYKIRQATLQKIPYLLVVGEKEAEAGVVNVRSRDRGEMGSMPTTEFIASLEPFTVPQVISALKRGDSLVPEALAATGV